MYLKNFFIYPCSVPVTSCSRICPTLSLGNDFIICKNNFKDTSLNATIGFDSYLWEDGSTSSTYVLDVNSLSPDGIYWVQANKAGCPTASDSIHIKFLELNKEDVPNLITPNNDNLNETFSISSNDEIILEIYNRWGKLIYISDNYKNNWNTSNISEGIYYYYIRGNHCKNESKGWLQIIR
jgi:gliding motility-associated-like protein